MMMKTMKTEKLIGEIKVKERILVAARKKKIP